MTTGLKESSADVHLDSDALFVKNCCAIVHCHRRLISDLLREQQLLIKAAKMYQLVFLCCFVTNTLLNLFFYLFLNPNILSFLGLKY